MITLTKEEQVYVDHIAKLDAELQAKTALRDELEQEIAKLQGVREASNSDIKSISNTRDTIMSEFEVMSEQLNFTQSQIEESIIKRKNELEKAAEVLKAEEETIKNSIETNKSILEAMTVNKEQLEASVVNLASMRDKYIELNSAANEEYLVKTKENRDLTIGIEKINKEIEELINKKTVESDELAVLVGDKKKIKEDIYSLSKELSDMEVTLDIIKTKEAKIEEEYKRLGLK